MIKKLTIGCVGILLSLNTAFATDKLHSGKVLEFKNSGGYTYIKLEEKGKEYWAAVPAAKIVIGDTITIKEQTMMKNFKSKTLNKTFEEIMFADMTNKKGIVSSKFVHGVHGQLEKKKKPTPKFDAITVTKGESVKTTISDIYDNKVKYTNKNVEVEGEVLHVSNKVMGNTWVKVFDGKDALIFRSPNEDEKVKKGDKVKVSGTINVDVDYGYGFKYEAIGVNANFTLLK